MKDAVVMDAHDREVGERREVGGGTGALRRTASPATGTWSMIVGTVGEGGRGYVLRAP